jgi:hypothetical protein
MKFFYLALILIAFVAGGSVLSEWIEEYFGGMD